MFGLSLLFRRLLYAAIFFGIIHIWLSRKSYTFDQAEIAAIVKRHALSAAAGTNNVELIRGSLKKIHNDLKKFEFVLPQADLKWVKVNLGSGAVSLCFLHVSPTEYAAFVGAALPSTAHFGRYWVNVTHHPIAGSIDVWQDTYATNTYSAGQPFTVMAGDSAIVHYKPGFWSVEYGRGFVPSALPHVLGGMLFQSQDPLVLVHLFEAFFKTTAQWIVHEINTFKSPF